MRFEGRIRRDGRFWLVEIPAFDAATQGRSKREALAMARDLIETMAEHCGPAEPPARLHGDLWAGNRIADERGQPCLIDPAAYGGHREIDLAMMKLFGGFGPRVFDAYGEAAPLAPGTEERAALYQLYPLLVHVNLFGGGYVGQVASAARRYL